MLAEVIGLLQRNTLMLMHDACLQSRAATHNP